MKIPTNKQIALETVTPYWNIVKMEVLRVEYSWENLAMRDKLRNMRFKIWD